MGKHDMCINDTNTQWTHVLGLEGHETLTRALMGNKQSKQLADIECKTFIKYNMESRRGRTVQPTTRCRRFYNALQNV